MVGGAAGGAFAGMVIAKNAQRLKAELAAVSDAWKDLAKDGLALSEEKGRPVLRGTIDGVPCAIDVVTDAVQCGYTRVVAKPLAKLEATVGLYPQPPGVLGKLRALIGQDIEIGDEAFDQAFLVHGKPESAAKSLFADADLRGRVLALLGQYFLSFELEPERVVLQFGKIERDPELLRAALSVVVRAARWKP